MCRNLLILLTAALLWACGGSDETNSTTTGPSGSGGETSVSIGSSLTKPGSGGSGSTGWQMLIEGEWQLESGTEGYVCASTTVEETIYIKSIRPVAPKGTHHTVLSRGGPGSGVEACSASTNGPEMIYGSAVGTKTLFLPDGVAVKLEAGEKLLLNLHLFNIDTNPLAGLSGIEVELVDVADIEHHAESVLAGTLSIDIPPQGTKTEIGDCSIPTDLAIFFDRTAHAPVGHPHDRERHCRR